MVNSSDMKHVTRTTVKIIHDETTQGIVPAFFSSMRAVRAGEKKFV